MPSIKLKLSKDRINKDMRRIGAPLVSFGLAIVALAVISDSIKEFIVLVLVLTMMILILGPIIHGALTNAGLR